MSYLVLARKYRPQTFADVVGQGPIVKTLQNSLLRGRVAHAILFSGVRGVGKTTLARIMAKAINCQGESNNRPCDICQSCSEIIKGSALDLYEIDGASNRGIQEIRELKEKIRFLPSSAQYKIIIIDEVHMLTTEAFNALLKTLEEPPEHVYFMFATTELHKIPITILSRCQQYELKRISATELANHFKKIAKAEGVTIEPAALSLIVREAEGSVRDGLSLLDQMFSFGDTNISMGDVVQVLGITDRNILMSISRALLAKDHAGALKALDAAFDYGIDIKRFTTDLLECFRTMLLLKIGGCMELIDLPKEEIQIFQGLTELYSLETIHMKLTLLMQVTEQLRQATQPKLKLETAFLRIIEADNVVPVSTLINTINGYLSGQPQEQLDLPAQPIITKNIAQTATLSAGINHEQGLPPNFPQAEEDKQVPHLNQDTAPLSIVPESNLSFDSPPPLDLSKPELPSDTPAPGTAAIEIHPHTHDVRRDWTEFTDYIKDRKIWMSQDLQRAISVKEAGKELHLHYSDPANCALLREKDNRKLLTEFVLDFFQKDLTVRFILPDRNTNGDDSEDPLSPHAQRQQLAHDPLVQMAVEIFNGQVGDIRIGPRSR